MRKMIFALVLVAALVLSGCGGSHDPARMATGTGSYYLQSSSTAKALGATSSGTLYRVGSGDAGAVIFYDDAGRPVDVAVRHAISLSDGRLVLAITEGGVESCVIADPASGSLDAMAPEPTGWDYARESGGSLYYVSGSALYKTSLAGGTGARMSPEGATVSASSWLKVTSYGAVVVADGQSQTTYYADGRAPMATNLQLPDPSSLFALEGLDGTVYAVSMMGTSLAVTPYAESDTSGGYTAGTQETVATIPWTTSSGVVRLSSASSTHELVLGSEGGIVRVVATATGISYSVTALPAGLSGKTYIGGSSTFTTALGGAIYHAFHEDANWQGYDVTRYHVWSIATGALQARAIGDTTAELLADYNLGGLVAVGDALFYTRDAGSGVQTMIYDGTTPRVYADGAVSIEPVQ